MDNMEENDSTQEILNVLSVASNNMQIFNNILHMGDKIQLPKLEYKQGIFS